jgi:branched-chain amino acid transport system permease protein
LKPSFKRGAWVASVALTAFVIGSAPYAFPSYIAVWLLTVLLNISLAYGYDTLGGHAGLMHLGHCAFYGIGAYTAGLLYNLGLSFLLCLISAALVAACFAAISGFFLVRLRGAYFALAGLSLLGLLSLMCANLRDITGGSAGLSIPPGAAGPEAFYGAFFLAASAFVAVKLMITSRFGLGLRLIREDEDIAEEIGVPTARYKICALMAASAWAGASGALYLWHARYISPSSVFGLETALTPVVSAMLGGSGALFGPLIGVITLSIVQELIATRLPFLQTAAYGAVFITVGLFFPGGLIRSPLRSRIRSWRRKGR